MVPFSLICASRSFSSAAEDSLSASLDAEEASLLLAAPDVVPPEVHPVSTTAVSISTAISKESVLFMFSYSFA